MYEIYARAGLRLLTPPFIVTQATRTRFDGGATKKQPTKFQLSLEKLRRDRERRVSGGRVAPESSNDSDNEDDDDDDYDADDGEDDNNNENLDTDLTGFVVDGDDESGDIEMPLQFTSAAHSSNDEQFQIYAEYLIKTILFPGQPKTDRVANAIRRLESVAGDYGNTVAMGATWSPNYARALRARPRLKMETVGPQLHEQKKCDACNHVRMCGSRVQFCGRRYNTETLEDLSEDEDEASEDGLGNQVLPETTWYNLGASCFERTRHAHTLHHWKKQLKSHLAARLVTKLVIDNAGAVLDERVKKMNTVGMLFLRAAHDGGF